MDNDRPWGFTLIELLIVVAIIAILAAIATPNFLEVQTRSKVSRVHADMRSISVSLEAYRVDNSHYPPNIDGAGTANVMDMSMMMANAWMPFVPFNLTTPVSYMTDLPLDVFDPRIMMSEPVTSGPHDHHHKHTFMYFNSTNTPDQSQRRDYRNTIEGQSMETDGFNTPEWFMISPGPDKEVGAMAMEMAVNNNLPIYGIMTGGMGMGSALRYDPSNGTTSHGDLIHYGP